MFSSNVQNHLYFLVQILVEGKSFYCEKVQGSDVFVVVAGHCCGRNMQARDCRRLIFMAIVEETREVLVPEMEGPETFNMIVVDIQHLDFQRFQ